MPFDFDCTYARLPERFFQRIRPTPVARPSLLALNLPLAERLGILEAELNGPTGVALLAGNDVCAGAEPIALAYAGHQFGSFVPQLGDGRAILLGEVVGQDGRRDVQLKGSGRTRFSRGGDGRSALGPVLREYVVSEAMAALGVPTTRALAMVATGEPVFRETPLPGAVLTRIASSHLRVGTFEYFAARGDREALELLVPYALDRHFPEAPRPDGGARALALLDAVLDAQAKLVAAWMSLGFVHGVMNTDNTSISGETLDYGPCAFLDAFRPRRSFSSIDRSGRYAFGNQPRIALWNLARLAEALAPVVDADADRAAAQLTTRLEAFPARFLEEYTAAIRPKLGLLTARPGDLELAEGLLDRMAEDEVDFTLGFRCLMDAAEHREDRLLALFKTQEPLRAWLAAWHRRLTDEPAPVENRVARMALANPAFIPRNHRIEEMIAAAIAGDLAPMHRLLRVLADPYRDQPEHADLAESPGPEQWSYRTFCGT